MATATQLPLDLSLPPVRLEHGGGVGQGKRKTSRPYSSRRPMHAVFRSSRARQSWSLRRRENHATVTRTVGEAAKRFGVVVYRMAVVGNHVHILLRARSRKELQSFLRMVTGQIAQHVTGARRGAPTGRFWDSIVYTRLITWGREYATVLRYVELNEDGWTRVPDPDHRNRRTDAPTRRIDRKTPE